MVLTVVDRFSGFVHFVSLQKLPSAAGTGNLSVQHVFRLNGIPKDIVSDRSPQFTLGVWKSFCSALVVSVSLSSGYHPKSNGQTERMNQTLRNALRCMAAQQPTTCSTYLPWVEYSQNSLVSPSSCVSPFMAALGYQPPLFDYQEKEATIPSVQAHLRWCQRVWRQVRESRLRSSLRSQLQANRRRVPAPRYHPGQWVRLSAKDLPLRVECRKLAPRFF